MKTAGEFWLILVLGHTLRGTHFPKPPLERDGGCSEPLRDHQVWPIHYLPTEAGEQHLHAVHSPCFVGEMCRDQMREGTFVDRHLCSQTACLSPFTAPHPQNTQMHIHFFSQGKDASTYLTWTYYYYDNNSEYFSVTSIVRYYNFYLLFTIS